MKYSCTLSAKFVVDIDSLVPEDMAIENAYRALNDSINRINKNFQFINIENNNIILDKLK